jgi:hypothetical protein
MRFFSDKQLCSYVFSRGCGKRDGRGDVEHLEHINKRIAH